MAQQAIGQDDNVLDSQRRPQPDGEMSGVSTISGQHDLAVMPGLIADIPEVEPLGRRTIGNLPDELVMTNYFSVRDDKIVSLAVIFNQASPYAASA